MFLQNSNSSKIIENVSQVNNVVQNSLENLLNSILERLPYIVAGFLVLLLFWLLSKILKAIFWSASKRTRIDNRLRILFSRLISVGIIILGIFTALTIIIPSLSFSSLITGLGFTSFVIGFATKDILNNLLSGVLILWHQTFRIGDYIFVGNNQGKVEYIGVRATNLRKDDGEMIIIPNGDMYSSALTIRSAGSQRRMKLNLAIGYDSDITKSKEIIENILTNSPEITNEPKPNVVVTDLTSDGINISIYFWVDTDKFPALQAFDSVATTINKSLSQAKIEMFPPNSIIVQTNDNNNDVTKLKKAKDLI
ncbi:MAG: mechanosensitive ion channel family protein [Pyrinomonadaceae bacterium]|jgi:small-conductance mechanosensitive channel|nr:mechanosensitive ion channel family protein [Pyrinomonadaceae bacterium]